MENPVLSIVVPTKNRYETLNVLITSLMSWESQDFELVIQDNSDDNQPVQAILDLFKDDHRLKYDYKSGEFDATKNCNFGMQRAKGHYICILGDDDGIVEMSLEVCRWSKEQNIDALSCYRIGYTWPDITFKYAHNNHMKGKLIYKSYTGKIKQENPSKELYSVAKVGASSMLNLPRLYHGFIRKACLDLLFEQCGTYFPGPVIDMSSAVGVIPYISSYYSIDLPLVISGNCSKSMAGKNLRKEHQGDIRTQKSLPPDTYDNWSNKIPKYWSGPTIWAETFTKACECTEQTDVLSQFNYAYICAGCLAYTDSQYYGKVWNVVKKTPIGKRLPMVLQIATIFSKITMQRLRTAFSKVLQHKKETNIKHFENIDEAIKQIQQDINASFNIEEMLGLVK